jgi:2-isopropylmalate synthase
MEKKLRMSAEEVYLRACTAVRFARQFTNDVEFSPEDGSRSDPDFLCRVIEGVIKEGATTINVPDTVGYAMPVEFAEGLRKLRERIPNSDKAIWSVHCHNDLGLAVANSLAAVRYGGARQIECTINGLGERAGNASLEEVVMAVKTRRDLFGLDVGVNAMHLVAASRAVAEATGFSVPANKAVVGANAFAHASGIHQDGILKARETYEIMRPEDVGWDKGALVLGKLSGRNAFKHRVQELGMHFPDDEGLSAAFARFKRLADTKAVITDDDLRHIALGVAESSTVSAS